MICAKLHETTSARHAPARRAFSLIELLSVLAIVALLSTMAMMRFGTTAVQSTSAEGFVRTLMLDLRQARARTISTGDNHYVLMSRSGGNVAGYTLYRDLNSGDSVVDRAVVVSPGITVTALSDQWEFDFDGSLGGGVGTSQIVVTGAHYVWTITVYRATGSIKSAKVAL
jgi:prepilin-type N-terminal cleavage/methylation domain-containing protein